MERTEHAYWGSNRGRWRIDLWGETNDNQHLAVSSYAANAREGLAGGAPGGNETRKDTVSHNIFAILTQQNQNVQQNEHCPVIFAIVPEALKGVAAATAEALDVWEATQAAKNQPSFLTPLAHKRQPTEQFTDETTEQVIETAAAVCEVAQLCGYDLQRFDSDHIAKLGRLVALRGPAYASQWMLGRPLLYYAQALRNASDSQPRIYDPTTWMHIAGAQKRALFLLNNPLHPEKEASNFILSYLQQPVPDAAVPPQLTDPSANGMEAWKHLRPEYRRLLWEPPHPLHPVDRIPTLMRTILPYTSLLRTRKAPAVLGETVEAILQHPHLGHTPSGAIRSQDLPLVITLTRSIINKWERSCVRLHLPFILKDLLVERPVPIGVEDFNRLPVRLVVEIAQGAWEAVQLGFRPRYHHNAFPLEWLAYFIAAYGPDYAAHWINHGPSPLKDEKSNKELEKWHTLTHARRTYYAYRTMMRHLNEG